MKITRALVVVLALAVLVGGGLLLLSQAPTTSTAVVAACVTDGESCLQFPSVSGDNLPGETLTLPDDFQGEKVLVILPFDEEQQINAETWLPFAREVAGEDPDLTYYNVPVFPDIPAPIRTFIRAGMNVAISDEVLRELTITLFLENRDDFLAALDIPDTDAIRVLLLNDVGEVLWRGAGEFTAEQGEALRGVLAAA